MHSIITNKDTYVGVLTKMSFDLCFLDISEHFKNNLHSLILGSKLLKRLDSKIFKISYFSLFFHEINHEKFEIILVCVSLRFIKMVIAFIANAKIKFILGFTNRD